MRHAYLYVLVALLFTSEHVYSQVDHKTISNLNHSTIDKRQLESACSVCLLKLNLGLGSTLLPEKLPEGSYSPVLILGRANFSLGTPEKSGGFSLYVEPQFNPVALNGRMRDIEFGLNIGAEYHKQFNSVLGAYLAIGTGPHYISVDTKLQAGGFIFSDNFIFGTRLSLPHFATLDIQYRFRHISNASLQAPNNGIDNHFLVLGTSWQI